MKTQHNNIQLTSQLENTKNNTLIIDELAENATNIKANFGRADLWNIQRNRKTGVTYRKHL